MAYGKANSSPLFIKIIYLPFELSKAYCFIFPILIYLIYLATDKNINRKEQKLYLALSLYASFYLLYKFDFNNILVDLILLTSIIILFLLEDMWQMSIIFIFVSFIAYIKISNIYILFFGMYLSLIIYFLKRKKLLNTILFIELYVIFVNLIFFIWIYVFNKHYLSMNLILLILTNVFVINIVCLMYGIGKSALKVHLNYKELQNEKQIRMSLFKITHEIKNPIAVIKGYLDMLDVDNRKQVKRYIPIIRSETDRILTILQDFLLINKLNLELDIMDINLLVEDVVFKLEPLMKEKNIKLNIKLIDEEIYIYGDYNRLSQAFINILKNSIEAIDNNGSIDILSKIIDDKLEINIIDNGIGIRKEIIDRIKEPFYTTKNRGSGLGVSLIYEIIEAHKGKVIYNSVYNKGTKVSIQLPLYE